MRTEHIIMLITSIRTLLPHKLTNLVRYSVGTLPDRVNRIRN